MADDFVLALARMLQGKGNVSSGDLNVLFSPEVAQLTGTNYQSAEQAGMDEEMMLREYAPNFLYTRSLDPEDIRASLANALIVEGRAPWEVKRDAQAYASAQAEADGTYDFDANSKELENFVDTIFRESNALQVAKYKKQQKDTTNNLPPEDLDFALEQLEPELMQMLASSYSQVQSDKARTKVDPASVKYATEYLKGKRPAEEVATQKRSDVYAGKAGVGAVVGQGIKDIGGAIMRPFKEGSLSDTRKQRKEKKAASDLQEQNFQRSLRTVAERAADPQRIADEATAKQREKNLEQIMQVVAQLAQQNARAAGYTPYREALIRRANFISGGG